MYVLQSHLTCYYIETRSFPLPLLGFTGFLYKTPEFMQNTKLIHALILHTFWGFYVLTQKVFTNCTLKEASEG